MSCRGFVDGLTRFHHRLSEAFIYTIAILVNSHRLFDRYKTRGVARRRIPFRTGLNDTRDPIRVVAARQEPRTCTLHLMVVDRAQ